MMQIFQVGIPAGIQSTVINLSNVLLAVLGELFWLHSHGRVYSRK